MANDAIISTELCPIAAYPSVYMLLLTETIFPEVQAAC